MWPVFANPAGFWALLVLPAILAIHFLQQRSRPAITSTWFLIEKLVPRSVGGRTWERLRSSRVLWLQLLALLLATWWLVQPRWPRAESAQTVVVVLDSSIAMLPFREPALAAAASEFAAADGLAARTTWIILTSDPRQPPLYRGSEKEAAHAALARWQPQLGTHDLAPALRLAQSLAGESGRTLLVTDSRSKVPPGQRAAGVGQPISNVGFAGSTVTRQESGVFWRTFVQNQGVAIEHRSWWMETSGGRSSVQPIELPPGGLVEITGHFPAGIDECTIALESDEFPIDDHLPILRPIPKPLTLTIEGEGAAAEFFRKLAAGIDGVSIQSSDAGTLRIARLTADELRAEKRGGIFWPESDRRSSIPLMTEPVTAEQHVLVDHLNWQGWIGTGPHGYTAGPADAPLLWQDRWAFVFLRNSSTGAHQLCLGFDWERTNAPRLPAMMLLVRRFIAMERDAQSATFAANFDTSARLSLAVADAEQTSALTLTFEPSTGEAPAPRTLAPSEYLNLRAPGQPGFFSIEHGDKRLVRGSAQFADPRQGDFRNSETFFNDEPTQHHLAMERLTRPDPLASLWLALVVGLTLGSWWERSGGKRAS